ncbi:TPA: hypothetical protein P0E37_002782 [Vibrio campbellii]|uniref:hypothetical protein n=1 Tax=Vibrio campbellii TaxID=680 RepID=UPI0005ED9C59|nr:hypothetical protein [Vibrio campbellii]ARR44019.1 hypothetical protein CAY59_06450 [Vibrio campbellii]HDM8207723.1 hypothetical protein [Vibrio campbellii]HDM8218262.1 hypothetical protein [Vibrio campbellii]HDM8228315.1 hypothetical protein [Vibrio campbellii]
MKWLICLMALIGYEAVANERLQTAVEETPYSAVVLLTGFEGPEQDGGDNYYKVQAKVLNGIRGHITSKITFDMYTEVGDTPKIGIDPIVITLCHDEQGYYWPGTGSEFTVTQEQVLIAKEAAKNLSDGQIVFAHCDQ